MLELVKVCKSYRVGDNVTEALKNISISFRESEFVSVLGPSGCGKTTLLNIIGGLDRYDSGDLIVRGVSTKKYRDRNWDTYRNHSVGFVFQSYNLIPHQTVFSNVELALTLAGVSKSERRRRVHEALDKVGLSDQIYKKPNQMSGGQMQRVAIARAIVNDPEILLADEPTGALDSKTSVQIMEILKEISKDRLIIMVTHNPDLAEEYSTRIVKLKDGEIISDSDPFNATEIASYDNEPGTESEATNGDVNVTETAAEETETAAEETETAAEADQGTEDGEETLNEAEPAPDMESVTAFDDLSFEREAINKFRKIRAGVSGADRENDEAGAEQESCGAEAEAETCIDADETAAENGAETEPETAAENIDQTIDQNAPGTDTAQGGTVSNTDAAASDKDEKEDKQQKYSKGRKKKSSMSFFTAMSLSFKNLLTKKGRTFITAFAGSIGIIGIALILAISTGVKNYIDDVQRETLSSYPIAIESEHRDLSTILGKVRNKRENKAGDVKDNDTAYSNTSAYDLFNAIFSDSTKQNNLKDFKAWLDNEINSDDPETKISSYLNTVHYGYDLDINTYVKRNGEQDYKNTSVMNILGASGLGESMGFVSSAFSSSSYSYSLWDEIIPGKDGSPISQLIKDQYDLIYGKWPEEKNEILLLVDPNNEIPDMAFYTLGIMSRDELSSSIVSALAGKEVEFTEHKVRFEDLGKIDMKLVIPAYLYMSSDGGVTYSNIEEDNAKFQIFVNRKDDGDGVLQLKICGVIRANPDATATAISSNTTFCYTNLLTEYIIEETAKAESVKALLASEGENRDIFNGLPYFIDISGMTDAERIATFKGYKDSFTDAEKAEAYKKILTTPDDEYIASKIAEILSAETREQMENLVAESYGMDIDVIKKYLSSYSDEELEKMIRETAEKNIKEIYAREIEEQINETITKPSDLELAAAKLFLTQQFEAETPEQTMQNKMGFIALTWSNYGVMSMQDSYQYLMTLDPEKFESTFDNVIEMTAITMYKENAASDPDRIIRKLAEAFDEYVDNATDEQAVRGYELVTVKAVSENSYNDNKKMIGYVELDSPATINLYPETFENKEKIADIISDYNDKKESDDDKIYYTDYVAILMSGITTIINAISYVLIAFVSVSLFVSSIMIGIITYISVLERTKEIGILRSIGASKLDVSRVFTAETLIIGFFAGLLGIGLSYLLCLPINAIVHTLTKINTINAVIPWNAALILVAISMTLTLIAGLIPSFIASKKDPVVALRTE